MSRVPAAAEKNTKNAVEKDRRDAPDMEQKISVKKICRILY